MDRLVYSLIVNSALYHPIRSWKTGRRHKAELAAWETRGKIGAAPHLIKQQTIRKFAHQFGIKVFVETGTHIGDMVAAVRGHFDIIYSIELSETLYQYASRRFRRDPNVVLIHGDSGTEIKNVLRHLDQPALFWLDGHFSGGITARGDQDTPVMKELFHIFEAEKRDHVIILDDARLFGVDPSYPTVEDVQIYTRRYRDDLEITVADDSIRLVPRAILPDATN